jgi:F420-non-reducing hydrogenase large subunit
MTSTIVIDPITRLEGHGKISIFLDDAGAVEDCYFQIPELRGFERFVVGRPIEELPRIVTRICGVCPASHHMASAKAVDGCFGNEVAPVAHKLREMYYNAHYIHSHTAHFYALAAPDFVLGPDADPAIRNILGVVAKVGLEIGGKVIRCRGLAQEMQRVIGGRNTQDIWCLPGGVAKPLKPEELEQIKGWVAELYDFTQFSLQLFKDVVLANPTYVDIIVNGPYTLDVHNMGLVDANNAPSTLSRGRI